MREARRPSCSALSRTLADGIPFAHNVHANKHDHAARSSAWGAADPGYYRVIGIGVGKLGRPQIRVGGKKKGHDQQLRSVFLCAEGAAASREAR